MDFKAGSLAFIGTVITGLAALAVSKGGNKLIDKVLSDDDELRQAPDVSAFDLVTLPFNGDKTLVTFETSSVITTIAGSHKSGVLFEVVSLDPPQVNIWLDKTSISLSLILRFGSANSFTMDYDVPFTSIITQYDDIEVDAVGYADWTMLSGYNPPRTPVTNPSAPGYDPSYTMVEFLEKAYTDSRLFSRFRIRFLLGSVSFNSSLSGFKSFHIAYQDSDGNFHPIGCGARSMTYSPDPVIDTIISGAVEYQEAIEYAPAVPGIPYPSSGGYQVGEGGSMWQVYPIPEVVAAPEGFWFDFSLAGPAIDFLEQKFHAFLILNDGSQLKVGFNLPPFSDTLREQEFPYGKQKLAYDDKIVMEDVVHFPFSDPNLVDPFWVISNGLNIVVNVLLPFGDMKESDEITDLGLNGSEPDYTNQI